MKSATLETVEIAIQASLTGHLVLSTLHTNTAIGAVTRLQDMGVEPFLLSSSIIGVIAQRLVRVLCNECKEEATADAAECTILGIDPAQPPQIFHARGCDKCNQLGYRGRQGIYEIIEVDETMKTLIHDRAGEQAPWSVTRARWGQAFSRTVSAKYWPAAPPLKNYYGW